eukprot:CAMPEP_0172207992 /NCGR_PEP_ID=MMETSP1050-20130122/34179_1 /TAXON_ID=233186 /ORGANISM="Cryptomonas curvata, Strain CCAP979/52" /LENGTH=125 /DNA_ID=CAMNT_0012887443 /DNA_START=271 /DNA_END=650 /DNA_ORIENTATION=-
MPVSSGACAALHGTCDRAQARRSDANRPGCRHRGCPDSTSAAHDTRTQGTCAGRAAAPPVSKPGGKAHGSVELGAGQARGAAGVWEGGRDIGQVRIHHIAVAREVTVSWAAEENNRVHDDDQGAH